MTITNSQLNLSRARGLITGALYCKDMENFNKDGLFATLEEVRKILEELEKSSYEQENH